MLAEDRQETPFAGKTCSEAVETSHTSFCVEAQCYFYKTSEELEPLEILESERIGESLSELMNSITVGGSSTPRSILPNSLLQRKNYGE